MYEAEVSLTSNCAVMRNGNASSSRNIPSAWIFCASIPTVRTTPYLGELVGYRPTSWAPTG